MKYFVEFQGWADARKPEYLGDPVPLEIQGLEPSLLPGVGDHVSLPRAGKSILNGQVLSRYFKYCACPHDPQCAVTIVVGPSQKKDRDLAAAWPSDLPKAAATRSKRSAYFD